jgi:hypothetical protein
MKVFKSTLAIAILTILFVVSGPSVSYSEGQPIDLGKFILEDLQKTYMVGDDMAQVIWFPKDFFTVYAKNDPLMGGMEIESEIKFLDDILLFAVIDYKIGTFSTTYTPKSTIMATVKLKDSKSKIYYPIEESRISADAKGFISIMEPSMKQQMGEMGENLCFVCFPAKDSAGISFANPKKDGKFTIELGEKVFKYRLPLGSLMPAKYCLICDEDLKGNFNYCPFCGSKL